MSSQTQLLSVLLLSCLITGTWLSLRSWMRSIQNLVSAQSKLRVAQLLENREPVLRAVELLQRQQEHRLQELEARLEGRLNQASATLNRQHRLLLMEAMRPLAAALERQDKLAEIRQDSQQELLLEVLNSLQPPASQQIGQLLLTNSSRNSGS